MFGCLEKEKGMRNTTIDFTKCPWKIPNLFFSKKNHIMQHDIPDINNPSLRCQCCGKFAAVAMQNNAYFLSFFLFCNIGGGI